MSGKKVLGLVGSPNKDGLTNQLVSAALKGAAAAGAETELIQMSDYVVDACKDCLPWVCADNLKCAYEDEAIDVLSDKILSCGGLVLATPVYWADTTAMVRSLFIKMLRIYARSGPLWGLPALGIAVAGGSGNGLISGLRPLYHFFRIMRLRALDPLPVTRFDLEQVNERAENSGKQIAGMISERIPFESRDACGLWYDNLPYLSSSNSEERKLLAAIVYQAVPEGSKKDVEGNFAKVDTLAASGRKLESDIEISKIIDSASLKISR